jgi:hypothetical protein
MGKVVRIALVVVVAALAAAQLVPVERTNPPVESQVLAPPAVMAALKKSCWDCHSNETVWGWHTRIAPISWLAAHDVNEGREHLNFSRWDAMGAKRLEKLARELPVEVEEGEMPTALYVLAHPDARPSDADRAALVGWGRSLASAVAAPPSAFERAPRPAAQPQADHGAHDD